MCIGITVMSVADYTLATIKSSLILEELLPFIGVHEMHGHVGPNLGCCNKLVSTMPILSIAPPPDTTTLLVARYLLFKTLVARQLLQELTNVQSY